MHSSAKHEGPFGVSPPLALAVGLGVLLVVRLIALAWNATDLFFDEAQYWSWSREPSFGYYSKPPLIAWIIAVATSVCGDGEACIRLPAPLIHTATAVIVRSRWPSRVARYLLEMTPSPTTPTLCGWPTATPSG